MPTPEQIEAARKIVEEADKAKYWPRGSKLISAYGSIVALSSHEGPYQKGDMRELTSKELEILKQIPEFARALK